MGVVDSVGPGVTKLKKGDVSPFVENTRKPKDSADLSRSESLFRSKSRVDNADTASRSSRRSVTEPTTPA